MSTYAGRTAAPPLGVAPNFVRRRLVAAAVAAALAAVVVALSTLGGGERVGPLDWSGDADVFVHPTLPDDRVLTGRLRNDGLHPLRVDIGDVRLLDADGNEVASAPVFLQAFGKTLWAAGRGPVQEPDTELQRTGRIALLEPGEEVPLTVAWRTRDGEPARLDYGRGSLSLPG